MKSKIFLIRLASSKILEDNVKEEIDLEMERAIRKASLNLELRHNIYISCLEILRSDISPKHTYVVGVRSDNEADIAAFNPRRLRGIARWLRKMNKNRYEDLTVGKRILSYEECSDDLVAATDMLKAWKILF